MKQTSTAGSYRGRIQALVPSDRGFWLSLAAASALAIAAAGVFAATLVDGVEASILPASEIRMHLGR
ncbi:MAG TPA: hypothetical protein VFG21_03725 [Xanthomonadaceae bacterium]|nr:hypothetical protein [Xanthomonadaceae bacterium]